MCVIDFIQLQWVRKTSPPGINSDTIALAALVRDSLKLRVRDSLNSALDIGEITLVYNQIHPTRQMIFFFRPHFLLLSRIRLNLLKPGDKKDRNGYELLVLDTPKLFPCTVSVRPPCLYSMGIFPCLSVLACLFELVREMIKRGEALRKSKAAA